MTAARPSLTSVNLWDRHEARCIRTLLAALAKLEAGAIDEREPDLNRRLYKAIVAAQGDDARRGDEPLSVVVPEGQNPPDPTDATRATRERKIPDFYWAFVDYLAAEPDAFARQFVVECKRLSRATRSWDFLSQYTDAGVIRFTTAEHGYGKGSPAGAMVGYLQDVEFLEAFEAVNAGLTRLGLPLVAADEAMAGDITTALRHELQRSFADSPFRLLHLWLQTASPSSA